VQIPAERKAPMPPPGLAVKGRALWRKIVKAYDLRADELLVLARLCKTVDRIAQLDVIADASPAIIIGSHGGKVIHPAIVELRQQELVLARLVRVLALPDADQAYGRQLPGVRSARGSGRHGHRAG
jgi:hypothetical protein